jgi:hypothetical protein
MRPVDMASDLALIALENGGSTAMPDRIFADLLKGYKKGGGFRRLEGEGSLNFLSTGSRHLKCQTFV